MPKLSLTHTQYTQVEMYPFQPLQVEKYDLCWPWITAETLVYTWRVTAARHMRIPILQKTWDKKIKHYLHVCVFFVTEIPRREEIMTKVRKCPVCASWNAHHAQSIQKHILFRWWCRSRISLTWWRYTTYPSIMQPWMMGTVSIGYWCKRSRGKRE